MSGPDEPEPREQHFDPWAITGYLIAGMVFYGAVGWGVDRWVGTSDVFFPIGIVFGLVAGLYLTFRRLSLMERQERAAYLAEKQRYLQEPQYPRQQDSTAQHDPKQDR